MLFRSHRPCHGAGADGGLHLRLSGPGVSAGGGVVLLRAEEKNDLLSDGRKPIKEVKLIARPFVALGRYIHDSWSELCLVRWPDRKATWKMTFAVLAYCAVMMVFILLLDTLFTFLFNLAFK